MALKAIVGVMFFMVRWVAHGLVIFVFLACTVSAQSPGGMHLPPTWSNLDIMLQQGAVNLQMLDDLDQERKFQLENSTEATLSKWDLKAPRKARGEYNKGLKLFEHKDYQNAVEHFTKAVSIYKDFVSAHNALGCVYFDLGKNTLAQGEFTKAIQLDDHLSNSYSNLGRVEIALGNFPAAEMAIQEATSVAPRDLHLLTTLTYLQLLNHKYAAAIKTAQNVHSHEHQGAAIVHYFAAAALQAQNNLDGTYEQLQMFLAEDPNSTFAGPARQTAEEIQANLAAPSESAAANKDAPDIDATSDPPSPHGQKVLQDIQEKKQIAEEETAAEKDCNTCGVPTHAIQTAVPHDAKTNKKILVNANGWTLQSAVDDVEVFFTATDHGKSISNLTQKELTVLDDQKPPVEVLGFRNEAELPLRLGLLIDTSDSVTERFSFEQSAASDFLERVLTSTNDLAFVAGFSNSVVLAQDLTNDHARISHGISELVPVGGTAVWDAVSFAADKLASVKEEHPVAKVLVVISDGDDNSSHSTLKQVIDHVEQDEVIIYTVSTRYTTDINNEDDVAGNRAMKVLAQNTGGTAFFPGSARNLNHSLAELQQVLRSRYLISYKPALFKHDGQYRTIDIAAKKSGHKLRIYSRKGYYTSVN
jgi:Ca-activated chloride channel homolog